MTGKHFSADIVIPLYNNWPALSALSKEIRAWIDMYTSVNVFIVDDGSTEANKLPPPIQNEPRAKLVRHEENRGRASALNSGYRAGQSQFVVFLDVDCLPQEDWLDHFRAEESRSGADCIFGNLRAEGVSYWARYLNELYAKKADAYSKGSLDFNTPFCMFRRELLNQVGGFHEEYRRYGFEDRDLIQNLRAKVGIKPLFLPDVYATHSPPTSVQSVLKKASESGSSSARIFANRFPDYYRKTGYWFFDSRQHSRPYNIFMAFLWLLVDRNVLGIKTLMERQSLPYPVWKSLVKLSSGLAFFHGTSFRRVTHCSQFSSI